MTDINGMLEAMRVASARQPNWDVTVEDRYSYKPVYSMAIAMLDHLLSNITDATEEAAARAIAQYLHGSSEDWPIYVSQARITLKAYLKAVKAELEAGQEMQPRVHNKHKRTAPANAVYIGRGSPWGNPYMIGFDGNRDEVCDKFEANILPTLDVSRLRGRHLVCYCAPARCHGDAILRKANEDPQP